MCDRVVILRLVAVVDYVQRDQIWQNSLQVFGKFLMVYFLFDKLLSLLWQICDIIGLILIVAIDQILENDLTICQLIIHGTDLQPFLVMLAYEHANTL